MSELLQKNAAPGDDDGAWRDHIIDTPSRRLGPRASHALVNDPRWLVFTLSRYKFVAKMLAAKKTAVEIGCGDSFGAPVVAQSLDSLLCVDIESRLIESNRDRLSDLEKISWRTLDIVHEPLPGTFQAAYCLDVLEHLRPEDEPALFRHVRDALDDDGVFIVGTPNVAAERYASKPGHSPHINLKDEAGLRAAFRPFFRNTFLFGMNDETLHTGFSPMAHYLFAMGVGVKRRDEA